MELPGTYLEVHPEVGASGLGGLGRVIRFGGVPSHDDSEEVEMIINECRFWVIIWLI